MPDITINDFSDGLQTFGSPRQLKGFQTFENVDNLKPGRLEKPLGEANKTATETIEYIVGAQGNLVPQGYGYIGYRTEYENSATPVQTSTLWHVLYVVKKTTIGTTLAADINTTATALETGAAHGLAVNDLIILDSEVMLVTVISSAITFAVTRNVAGTNAAHSSGITVYYVNMSIIRYNNADGTGGSWETILGQKKAGDWTAYTALAKISYYVYRGILRISDGLFTQANVSKLYAHIKREIWGNGTVSGISYGANQIPNYYQPAQNEDRNAWELFNQELKPPICVKMDSAMDSGNAVDAEREVGLYVYDPRHSYGTLESDRHWVWPDAVGKNPFKKNDRYAITYVYDYVQESELSRDADGNLGITGFEAITESPEEEEIAINAGADLLVNDAAGFSAAALTFDVDLGTALKQYSYIRIDQEIIFIAGIAGNSLTVLRGQLDTSAAFHEDNSNIYVVPSPQKARAINLVVYTGAANASWNRRITGINVYWQPEGEVDWFLVDHFDTEQGFSKSSNAVFEPAPPTFLHPRADKNNWGYWTRCPSGTKREAGFGTITAAGPTTWTDAAYYQLTVANDIGISTDKGAATAAVSVFFNMLYAVRGRITSVTTNNVANFTSGVEPINRLGYSAGSNADAEHPDLATFIPTTDKLTNWYLPFDGLRVATYQSLTGRASTHKLKAIRWVTADVSDDGMAAIFNVDTVDENDQTVRERSRVYWTPPGRPDEFNVIRSRDIGKDDGDEGVAVAYWNDRWYFMKDRNTYVYSKDMSVRLAYYPGFGSKFRHSFAKTPFGIVACDDNQITLFGNEPLELTLGWRSDYQALTLNNPVLTYSPTTNELYFINDTSEDDLVLYKFSFDNKSWRKQTLEDNAVLSNLVLGDGLEPLAGFQITGDTARIKEFNTGSASTETAKFKKRFDFGDPNIKKTIRGIWATYKTDAMTVDSTADTAEAVSINETGIDVSSSAPFAANEFIKIDNEIMLVLSKITGEIQVVRGMAGTIAATHTSGTSIYKAADDLTIKLYYDGHSAADETLTFGAVEGLANQVIKPTTKSNEHKFVDVAAECAGEDLVIEDISLDIDPKGKKLTNA